MKLKKKSNPTTKEKSKSKNLSLTPMQSIEQLMGWKNVRVAPEIIDHLCDFLLEWSLKDDAISIGTGLKKFGMPSFKFREWLKKSDKLRYTYEVVKERIGENLFHLGVYKKGDPQTINRILPQFHESFTNAQTAEKDFKKELVSLRQDNATQALQNIAFVARTIEDTKAVKETMKRAKKNKDE